MRVLVTGGAGFLGSHLCERLLAQGHDILCVDNYFTGRKDNIAHLLGNPHFEAMRHDVTFPLYVEVDEIYNLACPASPIHYQFDPVQTTKTSVIGAINMLGLAKRVKAKIFQASTSEVYGDPTEHPQTEEYRGNVNPIGPRACYDEGKRAAETLFFDYNRQHRVRIRVARIFNTYGPRMHPNDGRVVSNFIVQALKGESITVYGDQTIHPQVESYWGNVNPIGPRACYDEGKRCAETLFFDYHRQHGVDIRVARIFNTYGPRMHPNDGRVVSNFIVQALHGKPITVYGGGTQTRSFCYVDDLIDAIVAFMDAEPGAIGPMNIGNPGEFTIRELAEKVIRLTGSSSKITFAPLPSDDPMQRRPDIRLAQKMIGWEPTVALEEGLKKTIAYFERRLHERR
jgi:nucleoside-diphosphate-sugar epimerase